MNTEKSHIHGKMAHAIKLTLGLAHFKNYCAALIFNHILLKIIKKLIFLKYSLRQI
jgi:hypothetical protein